MKIVSSTSEQDVVRCRAREKLDYPLRELAANLLRVVRGAGRPAELGSQMNNVLECFVQYREAVGHWPPSEVISQILAVRETESVDAWAASFPNPVEEVHIERWLSDGTFDKERAKDEIMRASLQIAASRLVGQTTQERTAENALYEGVRQLEKAREKRRSRR